MKSRFIAALAAVFLSRTGIRGGVTIDFDGPGELCLD